MTLHIKDLEIPVEEFALSSDLSRYVGGFLRISPELVKHVKIVKKSLDARRKSRIVYHFQLDVDMADEAAVMKSAGDLVSVAERRMIADPLDGLPVMRPLRHKPVIIGTGPAGTFAALTLAQGGQAAVLVDRGDAVEHRMRVVNRLRRDGELDPESNYCFGEGGAGTFSDGKLTCGKNHPLIRHIFELFIRHGGPEEILYEAHPHIGTDKLMRIAINMRRWLQAQGSEFLFRRRFVDFTAGGANARYLVHLDNGETLATDHLILAIGHSARDTYELLLNRGVAIVPKPFAVGARFEHPQDAINGIQFGRCAVLPAAEYKLVAHAGERGIWTFCMCPGGHLLPTSAQHEHLAINGMSYHARKSGSANAAVVVNVLKEDFYRGHPLDGMKFQQAIERASYIAGGGGYRSPAQRLPDFLAGRTSRGELNSTYRPGVTAARLDQVLPDFIVSALRGAVAEYNKKMPGFISPEALVVGVESKTSSPISMMRDKGLQSISHPGLFPAGEGAGFAGGIVSASLDGVRIGRAVLEDALTAQADVTKGTEYFYSN